MLVTINGEQTILDDVRTIAGLINRLKLEGRIAVEVNLEIVPRSQFNQFVINDGDVIEIVRAIGGG